MDARQLVGRVNPGEIVFYNGRCKCGARELTKSRYFDFIASPRGHVLCAYLFEENRNEAGNLGTDEV